MCLKCKEEVTNSPTQVNFIDDNFGIIFELFLFTINYKKKVYGVLESFLSFKKRYEKRKFHNMLCLMLDPIFKPLFRIFFISHEEGVTIVEEHHTRSLYFMLLK
jgi:hypothetical protein